MSVDPRPRETEAEFSNEVWPKSGGIAENGGAIVACDLPLLAVDAFAGKGLIDARRKARILGTTVGQEKMMPVAEVVIELQKQIARVIQARGVLDEVLRDG